MTVKLKTAVQIGTLYNEGEIATFDAETEAKMIAADQAEAYEAPADDAPAATPAAKK